jgi:hypothetical protein
MKHLPDQPPENVVAALTRLAFRDPSSPYSEPDLYLDADECRRVYAAIRDALPVPHPVARVVGRKDVPAVGAVPGRAVYSIHVTDPAADMAVGQELYTG